MTGFERATLRWARVAVIMSGLAAMFVCLQWWEMHTGSRDTHDLAVAAKTQADKMSDMSTAADKIRQAAEGMTTQEQRIAENAEKGLVASSKQGKASLSASIEALRLDQRAWVVLKGIGPAPELDKPWNLSAVFDNVGKAPAKKVAFTCNAQPAADESGINWKQSPVSHEILLMSPNDQHYCTLHPTPLPKVTQAVLDELNKPGVRLYVVGSVVYQDIFEKWHWLTFCRWMHADGKEWDSCINGGDTGDGKIPPPPFDALAN